MEINELLDQIRQMTAASVGIIPVDGSNVPAMLVPNDCKLQAVPELIYNEHTERPEAIRQTVNVLDVASFVTYHALFADSDTRTFAWEPGSKITTVFDYHETIAEESPALPRWGRHKLVLEMRHSEEWLIWTQNNNKSMTQAQFAEFMEQHAVDISEPSPASIREVTDDFYATSETEIVSVNRQVSGSTSYRFTENTRGGTKAGEHSFPDRFRIFIPIYIGASAVSIDALLRWRHKENKLSFFYTLVRPNAAVRVAFQAARDYIDSNISDSPIINGSVG